MSAKDNSFGNNKHVNHVNNCEKHLKYKSFRMSVVCFICFISTCQNKDILSILQVSHRQIFPFLIIININLSILF